MGLHESYCRCKACLQNNVQIICVPVNVLPAKVNDSMIVKNSTSLGIKSVSNVP